MQRMGEMQDDPSPKRVRPLSTLHQPQLLWIVGIAIALLAAGCERMIEYLPPIPDVGALTSDRSTPQPAAQSAKTAQIETAIRQQINQVRQQNGLTALKPNERLASVARNYSQQMAAKNFFSHTGADGSTLVQRVKAGGISYWIVGENLFKSTNIPNPVPVAVEGWMKSPGHRENILRPAFTETGVGVWQTGSTYYVTQLFLRR